MTVVMLLKLVDRNFIQTILKTFGASLNVVSLVSIILYLQNIYNAIVLSLDYPVHSDKNELPAYSGLNFPFFNSIATRQNPVKINNTKRTTTVAEKSQSIS